MIEGKMVGWHHQLNGHEFEQALGNGEGQERLACCSPWDHKELDMSNYAKAFDCVVHNKLWKILKEMRITDHLTCHLRNLYAGQEATV